MNPPTPSSHSSTSAPSAPHGIAELAQRSQWVCHNAYAQNGRGSKVPLRADGLGNASSSRFRHLVVVQFGARGLPARGGNRSGLRLHQHPDPYVGIDLDKCVAEDRTVAPWAQEIIDGCASYTEFSPSRKGVHIIVRGKLSTGRATFDLCQSREGRSIRAWSILHDDRLDHSGARNHSGQAAFSGLVARTLPFA